MAKKSYPKPNEAERQFLNLSYNKFYDLYEEIMSDDFWETEETHRFNKIKDCFLIYSEILTYEPFETIFEYLERGREKFEHFDQYKPNIENKIAKDYFIFIRNLFTHFPFFSKWSEVFFSRELINWHSEGRSIDKFLSKFENHETVKYRLWNFEKKAFIYITIGFPADYRSNKKIFLSEMLKEKEGVIFSVVFMRRVIDINIIKD